MITILTPSIDRPTLTQTVRSIERQTLPPVEHIIEMDPNRTGPGPTLNRALAKVTTPWVGWVADDDVLHPRYCELFMETVTKDPSIDAVIFQMEIQGSFPHLNGVSRLPIVTDASQLHGADVGSSFGGRTELIRDIGFISTPGTEDWPMLHELIHARKQKVVIVPQVMMYLRHDPFE